MKTKMTTVALLTGLSLIIASCGNKNNEQQTDSSGIPSEEGSVVLNNDPNNYYYKNIFRKFDEDSPEYLKWKDTLTGKSIVVDLFLKSNPKGMLSYLPMLDNGFNKYKFWGHLYSKTAKDNFQPNIVFKFDIDPNSPNANNIIDNFKASDYELVWDSKAKKTFNHDKRIDNILQQIESCYSGRVGKDFLTIILNDKYFDDLGTKSSQAYSCLLSYDKSLAEEYKSGNFYTVRFGDEFISKETIEHSEHFCNIDTKGNVAGNYLQSAKIKATIEEVSLNGFGMLLFKLKDAEIIELKPTSSLDFLMTLTPKAINVDVKKAEDEAKRIDQAIKDLNPEASSPY